MRPRLYQCAAIALCAGLLCANLAQAQFVTRGGAAARPAQPSFLGDGAAVPAPPAAISQSVISVVNDEPITQFDLNQRIRLIVVTENIPQEQIQSLLPLLQAEALSQLIDEKVQMQDLRKESTERKAKDIIMSDKEVDAEIAQTADGNKMSLADFFSFLASRGITPASYREQVRISNSWDGWIRSLYRNRLVVSESQIANFQRLNAELVSKGQYHLAEVLLDPSKVAGGVDATVTAAKGIVEQINSGAATFAAAARSFSVAASAVQDGDMGIVTADALPPQVAAVLPSLKIGEISAPIPAADGVYLIQMIDKREPSTAIMATLTQAAVTLPANPAPADLTAAQDKLLQVRNEAGAGGCSGLRAAVGKVKGVSASDLGEALITDLSPSFREAVATLEVGQISQPLRSEAGLHLIAVCGKRNGGQQQLTREDVTNKLAGDELEQIKRAQTRNLRALATIISPGVN
ncbi:MAG: peptidylprolyl isomerase [Caulobacteraceae bacterium]|nr:peptidylprolyl isomerase [Caulobacteraceae bacterium]